eukprot:3250620-Prorocentrum_lima.AAC.1
MQAACACGGEEATWCDLVIFGNGAPLARRGGYGAGGALRSAGKGRRGMVENKPNVYGKSCCSPQEQRPLLQRTHHHLP